MRERENERAKFSTLGNGVVGLLGLKKSEKLRHLFHTQLSSSKYFTVDGCGLNSCAAYKEIYSTCEPLLSPTTFTKSILVSSQEDVLSQCRILKYIKDRPCPCVIVGCSVFKKI